MENPSVFWSKNEESFGILDILEEQAEALDEFTEGWVKGIVKTSSIADGFEARLSVYPATIEYTFEVLRISFSLDQYPVTILVDENIGLELFQEANPILRAEDESEFVYHIMAILGSHTVARTIQTLEALAKGGV